MWSDNTVYTNDKDTIINFVAHRSESLFEYLKKEQVGSHYSMWYKSLTHSDLTTRGKRTNSSDGFERNLLYYLSVGDMNNLQLEFPNKKFECSKQSNIGMPEDFYQDLKIPRIQRRKGQQTEKHNWVSLNEYMDVCLVNDTLKFFSLEYSEKTMNILGKEMPRRWKSSIIKLDTDSSFTEIKLHEAIHGLGVEADIVFHALRLTMFLNDTIIFVMEHSADKPKLFILLEKNPSFFYLHGIKNNKWANDERIRRYQERLLIKEGLDIEPPKKIYENEWDNTLLP